MNPSLLLGLLLLSVAGYAQNLTPVNVLHTNPGQKLASQMWNLVDPDGDYSPRQIAEQYWQVNLY
ncbi:MAG: hypothetical protein O6945_07785 [Gammaproteobacteria bacterium]|nr:hypothetical protein [Gammaproteobacteria bacterium]